MPKVSESHQKRQRERILTAAASRFADNGFQATSMDDIINAVGMSSSTVYNYFPQGKQQIIAEVCSSRATETIQRIVSFAQSETPPTIDEVFAVVFNPTEDQLNGEPVDSGSRVPQARLALHAWAETVRDSNLRESIGDRYRSSFEVLAALVDRWKDVGTVDPNLDTSDVVGILMNFYYGAIVGHLLTGRVDFCHEFQALQRILAP